MTLNLAPPKNPPELKPRIVVFGVGGAGCNAVNNMIQANMEGVECVVANTDSQALTQTLAERKIQLGLSITQGLGAGSRPEIGRAAAEEGIEDIQEQLQGGHMVFITAGMGGGTGTGAAPVIARAAREQGLLTVAVVTKPFHFEGAHRMRLAEQGLDELQEVVDTLIVIPNQNLFKVANEKTTFADAFAMADEVLHSGVRGITDLMVMPGLINLDFADIRTVMSEMGKAMMGAGEATGENRSIDAAEAAISNPLLDEVSMAGARGLLINITGGPDMTLYEVDEAANRVRDEVDPGANIIFGSTFDQALEGKIRVSVFATGIDTQAAARPRPAEVKVKTSAVAPTSAEPATNAPADKAPATPQQDMFGDPVKAATTAAPQDLVSAADVQEPAPVAPQAGTPAAVAPQPAVAPDNMPAASPNAATPSSGTQNSTSNSTMVLGSSHDTSAASPTSANADQALVARIIDPSVAEPDTVAPSAPEEPSRKKGHLFGGLRKLVSREQGDDEAPKAAGRERTPSMTVRTPRLTTADGPQAIPAAPQMVPAQPTVQPAAQPAPAQPAAAVASAAPQDDNRTVRLDDRREKAPAQTASPAPAAPRQQEDDLLDIPAFLRRQAN